MDIHIYTPEFEFLHTIVNPISVRWNLKYDDVGTLEIYVRPDDPAIPYFVENDELIIVQGKYSAWCNGSADDNGQFLISGRTLNWLLNTRQVLPFEMTDTIEDIIRLKIAEQFMTIGKKFVNGFILDDPVDFTEEITYKVEGAPKSLFNVVKELCKMANLGFEIRFDYFENKYIFSLYRGIDMSASQSDVPPIILSEVNRNLTQTQYLSNNEQYASCGYIRQVDEDTQEVSFSEVIKDDLTGFYRREVVLSAETEEDGVIELFTKNRVVEIEGNIVGVEFDKDFGLGDIVTLQKVVGGKTITQDRRVNEVIINQEVGNYTVTPVLGEVE